MPLISVFACFLWCRLCADKDFPKPPGFSPLGMDGAAFLATKEFHWVLKWLLRVAAASRFSQPVWLPVTMPACNSRAVVPNMWLLDFWKHYPPNKSIIVTYCRFVFLLGSREYHECLKFQHSLVLKTCSEIHLGDFLTLASFNKSGNSGLLAATSKFGSVRIHKGGGRSKEILWSLALTKYGHGYPPSLH